MYTHNVYDWLLVIYVHEIPLYIHQSNAILRTVLGAPAGGNVAVFVIKEAVTQNMAPLAGGSASPVNHYTLTVSKLERDERGFACFVPLPDEVLSVGREGWRHALRAIFPQVRARRRMLVSFSHGAAFGINVDMEGLMRSSGRCADLPIVWTADLAGELKNCLQDEAIDVLLFNNCYMQCMETGYLLREQVRFIVAAEGALGAIGYDYGKLMRRLMGQRETDAEEMARGIIDDYEQREGEAVFANRAGEYGAAVAMLERLVQVLLARFDEVIDVLVDIREHKLLYVSAPLNAYTSNYLGMIDLFAWVDMVFDRLGDLVAGSGFTAPAAEFSALRLRLVVAGKVGEGLVQHDAAGMPKYGYSGVSIFYPRSVDLALLKPIPGCACKIAQWDHFLERYYSRSRLDDRL